MLEVAKAMGLKLSRQAHHSLEESGLQDEHRVASLELPLVHYERRMESRKRKKMKWTAWMNCTFLMPNQIQFLL